MYSVSVPGYLSTTGYLQTISIIADMCIALRLLKIIGPRLVGQERTGNTQLLGYGSKHLGQNFFFYFIVLDRFFPEEPSLPRTGYFQTVATIQLVWCVPISTVFYYKRREKRLSNGPVYSRA